MNYAKELYELREKRDFLEQMIERNAFKSNRKDLFEELIKVENDIKKVLFKLNIEKRLKDE